MGAGGELKYSDYLQKLGLNTDNPTPEGKQVSKEEAISKAQAILEMAKNKASTSEDKLPHQP